MARLTSGESGSSRSCCHASDCSSPSWEASRFGSYDGDDTIARILPVDGSSATTEPLHGPPLQPFCMASQAACCTCGLMVVATLPPRGSRPVKKSASRRPNSRSSEPLRIGVLGALEAGAGVPQRVEAGDRGVRLRVRVDPQEAEVAVGRRRVGEQLAARGDLAALARVLVEQHALVARVGAQPVGGEDLGEGGVGEQQHDQGHDRDGDAAQ